MAIRLGHRWSARAKQAGITRMPSGTLPRRAAYFSDGIALASRSSPPRWPRCTGIALGKTCNQFGCRRDFFPHKTPPAGADGGLPGKFPPGTCSPTHARPALAGRHDGDVICLRRRTVNNPNLIVQSEHVAREEFVSKKGGMLLANSRNSPFYIGGSDEKSRLPDNFGQFANNIGRVGETIVAYLRRHLSCLNNSVSAAPPASTVRHARLVRCAHPG
jgi:hypothetical protein